MRQKIYRAVLFPLVWAVFKFIDVPEQEKEFESWEEAKKYHFNHDYTLDKVLLYWSVCFFGSIFVFVSKISDKFVETFDIEG